MSVSLPNVDGVRDNLKKIQKNLECPICLELLSDPYTTHCSHPFCRTCIYTVILSNKYAKCPLCKEPISKRSMNENTRLGEIVEAVKDLEQAIIKDTGITKTPPRALVSHSREASGTPGLIMHSLLHPTPQKHRPTPSSSKHVIKDSETTNDESPCTSASLVRQISSPPPLSNRRQSTGSAVIPSSPPLPCPPSSSNSGPVIRRKRRVRFASNKPSTRRSTRLMGMSVQSTMTSEHRTALLDAIENANFGCGTETRGVATDKHSQVKKQDVSPSSNSTSGAAGVSELNVFKVMSTSVPHNEETALTSTTLTQLNSVSVGDSLASVETHCSSERTEHVDDRQSSSSVTPQQSHTHKELSLFESHSTAHDVETVLPLSTVLETPFVGVAAIQLKEQDHISQNNDTSILADETRPLVAVNSHQPTVSPIMVQQVAETQFNTSPDVPAPSLMSDEPSGSLTEGVVKSCDNHVISPSNTATQTVVVNETQLTKMISPSLKDTHNELQSSSSSANNSNGDGMPSSDVQHQRLSPTANMSDCSPVIPLQNVPIGQPQSLPGDNAHSAVVSVDQKSPSGSLAHCSALSCMTEIHDIIPSSQPSPAHKPPHTIRTCLPHLRSQFNKRTHKLSLPLDTQHTQNATIQSSLLYSQDINSQELETLKLQAMEKEREIKELEAAISAAEKHQETTTNDSGVTTVVNFEPCSSSVDIKMGNGCDTLKRGSGTLALKPLPAQHKPDECLCVPSSLDCTTVIAETAPETSASNTQLESSNTYISVESTHETPSVRVENGISNIKNSSDKNDSEGKFDSNAAIAGSSLNNDGRYQSSSLHPTVPSSNKTKKKRRSSTSRRRRSRNVVDSQNNDSNSIEEMKILSVKKTTHQLNTATITTATNEPAHPLIKEADSLLRKLRAPPKAVLEERSKLEIDDALFDNNSSSLVANRSRSGCVYHTRSQSKRKSKIGNMTALTITCTGTPTPTKPGSSVDESHNKRKRKASSVTPTDNRQTKKPRLSSSRSAKKPIIVSTPQGGPYESKPSSTHRQGAQTTPTTSVPRLKATIVETPNIRLSGLRGGDSPPTVIASSNSKKQPLSFVGSGLTRIQLRQAQQLSKKHGGRIASCFNGSTTHVLVMVDENGLCPRTVKYLQGLAAGKWVVRYQWIEDSLEAGRLLPEDQYEVRGDRVVSVSDAPKLARQKRSHGEPGIFIDCTFLLLGNYGNLTPDQLSQLIQLSDGTVLPSLDDARHYSTQVIIVCDDEDLTHSVSITSCVWVPSTWVLDTLSKYSWQPPLLLAS